MILNRRKYKRFPFGGETYNLNGDPVGTVPQNNAPVFTESAVYGNQTQLPTQAPLPTYDAQSKAVVDKGIGAAATAVPIIGAFAKIGEAAGAQTVDEYGIYKGSNDVERAANSWVDNNLNPVTGISNFKDLSKDITFSTVANQLSGGLLGKSASQKKREKAKKEAEANYRREVTDYYTKAGEAKLVGYDQKGNNENAQIYKTGGELIPLNSDTVEVDGATHAEGGVKLPNVGAEVEDKETIAGSYVFSDYLGFAEKHKKIAKQIGKIEKKPLNNATQNSLLLLRGKEERLKQEQEELKAQLGLAPNGVMAAGGELPDPALNPERNWFADPSVYIDDAGNLVKRSPSQLLNLSSRERANADAAEFNEAFGLAGSFPLRKGAINKYKPRKANTDLTDIAQSKYSSIYLKD